MTIGKIIKIIREDHEMNQTDFANICMRTRDWLYLIETNSNKTKITKQDLILLSEELKSRSDSFGFFPKLYNSLFEFFIASSKLRPHNFSS